MQNGKHKAWAATGQQAECRQAVGAKEQGARHGQGEGLVTGHAKPPSPPPKAGRALACPLTRCPLAAQAAPRAVRRASPYSGPTLASVMMTYRVAGATASMSLATPAKMPRPTTTS